MKKNKYVELLWFIVALMPFVIFGFNCVVHHSMGDLDGVTNLLNIMEKFNVPFFSNPLYYVFHNIIGFPLSWSVVTVRYVSYLIFIELLRVFSDFLIFLPRIARSFLGKFYDLGD